MGRFILNVEIKQDTSVAVENPTPVIETPLTLYPVIIDEFPPADPEIHGLTPELRMAFEAGISISKDGLFGYCLGSGLGGLEYRKGASNMAYDVMKEGYCGVEPNSKNYILYQTFLARRRELSVETACTPHEKNTVQKEVTDFLMSKGIELDYNPSVPKGALYLLQKTVQCLPDSFFSLGLLKRISLGYQTGNDVVFRRGDAAYHNGSIEVSPSVASGSSRDFVILLVHELGHVVQHHFQKNPPPALTEAFRDITEHNAFLGTTFSAHNSEQRKNYCRSYDEFLAETFMLYMTQGNRLRNHIRSLPEGSSLRISWQKVYDIYKAFLEMEYA